MSANLTSIPVIIMPRPQPKPWCFACGCPCIDAGDYGRKELRIVTFRPAVRRWVKVCANCREDEA